MLKRIVLSSSVTQMHLSRFLFCQCFVAKWRTSMKWPAERNRTITSVKMDFQSWTCWTLFFRCLLWIIACDFVGGTFECTWNFLVQRRSAVDITDQLTTFVLPRVNFLETGFLLKIAKNAASSVLFIYSSSVHSAAIEREASLNQPVKICHEGEVGKRSKIPGQLPHGLKNINFSRRVLSKFSADSRITWSKSFYLLSK